MFSEGLQNVPALAKYITAKGDAWWDEFHLATEDDTRATYEDMRMYISGKVSHSNAESAIALLVKHRQSLRIGRWRVREWRIDRKMKR